MVNKGAREAGKLDLFRVVTPTAVSAILVLPARTILVAEDGSLTRMARETCQPPLYPCLPARTILAAVSLLPVSPPRLRLASAQPCRRKDAPEGYIVYDIRPGARILRDACFKIRRPAQPCTCTPRRVCPSLLGWRGMPKGHTKEGVPLVGAPSESPLVLLEQDRELDTGISWMRCAAKRRRRVCGWLGRSGSRELLVSVYPTDRRSRVATGAVGLLPAQ